MISGRKVLANDSSSYFGTPLFVSGDGGNPFRFSLFITLRFAAIRQRFYLCQSFLLYSVIPLLFVLIFILPPLFLYRYSFMCQAGRHTRLWLILSSIALCSIIVYPKNTSMENIVEKVTICYWNCSSIFGSLIPKKIVPSARNFRIAIARAHIQCATGRAL